MSSVTGRSVVSETLAGDWARFAGRGSRGKGDRRMARVGDLEGQVREYWDRDAATYDRSRGARSSDGCGAGRVGGEPP